MSSLDDAFASANEQLNNTESEAVEETVTEETSEETQESAEPVVEDTQTTDNQESFTKINPEELPEELKGTYKSLQADYTRKTQEIAKIRKESDERIAKLEEQLESLKQPETPRQKTHQEQLQAVIKQEIEATKESEFKQTAVREYEQADPRLQLDAETYDKATDLFVGQEMDDKLEQHLREGNPMYTFDYKSALKESLKNWDEYLVTKQKEFLSKQQAKAKETAKQVQKQNPKGNTSPGRPKKVSLDEAIELAQQKL